MIPQAPGRRTRTKRDSTSGAKPLARPPEAQTTTPGERAPEGAFNELVKRISWSIGTSLSIPYGRRSALQARVTPLVVKILAAFRAGEF